jgi:N-methylhydantoinase B/oxoprolinase/acetone carboxylase alpha subunit
VKAGTGEAAKLAVWQHRFAGICDEMGGALQRAAYSPNIKEREDFSCALFGPDGELVAQAEHIPVHLGSMRAAVAAVLDAMPDLAPGDEAVVNDPFGGGTHLNDITFVSAVCDPDGHRLGYVANRAHHADVGGAVPGSLSTDVPDSVAEGICLPPVRIVRAGRWDAGVRAVFLANTRMPDERAGDLDAQWGANRKGAARLAELAAAHGTGAVTAAMRELCDYAERRARAGCNRFGKGEVHEFCDHLEAADGELVPVCVRVCFDGNTVHADFSGTGPARPGVPAAVESVTWSAFEFALRCCLERDIPRNGGVARILRMTAPLGSVVAAQFPTPVGAGNVEASQRIADVVLGALAPVFPDRVGAASQGTMNNVLVGGAGPAGPFVYYETVAGGQGGRPGQAGQSGIHTGMTNTANTPVEALEAAYPLRVLRYALRRGSGGAGAQPGGDGVERVIEALVPVTVSLLGERRIVPPPGRDGGAPGARGEDWLLPGGRESQARRLRAKCSLHLDAGDVLRVRTPGGGGLGRATKVHQSSTE